MTKPKPKPKSRPVPRARIPVKAVFVDHVGEPVAEVPLPAPLPPSEWRRIWNAFTALAKGGS